MRPVRNNIIKNTLEEKKELKSFLNEIKDKPIFEEKISKINAILKDAPFATPAN